MDSDQAQTRRLILLRHAKSAWPEDVPDLDRPLAERGIADATVAGPLLAELAAADVVLCSPAVRTRQTWQLVSQALTHAPPARFEPVIYGASEPELLELIRSVPGDSRTVVVVGHEPTMSSTAGALAGPGSAADDLARLRRKFPTCALAVFDVAPPWTELEPGSAVLERFVVPRG
jgi:phosphohistidine phosphatase